MLCADNAGTTRQAIVRIGVIRAKPCSVNQRFTKRYCVRGIIRYLSINRINHGLSSLPKEPLSCRQWKCGRTIKATPDSHQTLFRYTDTHLTIYIPVYIMGLAMAAPKEPRQTFTDRYLNEVPSEKSLLVAPFGF